MLRSTFLGYKTATSALKVNQNMMDVVGQNMSNINTQGYTRQCLDINSVAFNTRNIKLGSNGVIIGQGVRASGVSQFRDPFLDLRYRIEASKAGSEQVQLEALGDLESILDEISMDKLDAQFSDLFSQLQSLTSSPSDPVMEGVVRTSAEILGQMFNDYSNDILTIKNQQLNYLEEEAVVRVNQILDGIAELNQQIKESNIGNNPALELNDDRNMLIDELSSYLNIDVEIKKLDIGDGKEIDELVIKLGGTDVDLVNRNVNSKVNIVNEDDITKINITIYKKDEDNKDVIIKDAGGNPTVDEGADKDITNKINGGQIDGYLRFLNGKGEFADVDDIMSYNKAANVKGVQYYEKMLDTLANKFAETMNGLNRVRILEDDGKQEVDGDGNLKYKNDNYLFEARDADPDDPDSLIIRAGNIKIHNKWASATDSYITNTTVDVEGDNAAATDNILKMINAFNSDNNFITKADDVEKKLFKGTFQEFLSYTTTKLNLQVADVQTSYDTYSESQFQIDYARRSMSSVDLNEEGINLLQYSKSFNAAAKLMTTLDEMLDTLINRM